MADAHFEIPRLAEVYDPLDPDRSDLEAYGAIVDEFGATSVLDIGCGTGTFACMLASRGKDVIGLDPAGASLEVARNKRGADRVAWVHGELGALPVLQVDQAWIRWTREATYTRVVLVGVGPVEHWVEVTDVREDFVSFRSTYIFEADGALYTSASTLRFRSRTQIEDSLGEAGFAVTDVREAPDRPGRELVFIARRSD